MKSTFEEIPIGHVYESKHNPRQHFDEAALHELADSVKTVGILTPLIVRPRIIKGHENGVEIAAGHRRYRAAKLAELATLPCRVMELDDQTFMEILTVENLQREDVHALDEAKGYEALMAAPYTMTVQTIADKVGRSVKYIYDRVKLLALTKEAQDLFWNGTITAGHAIILARLLPAEQQRCLEDRREGLLRPELGLYDPLKEEAGEDDDPLKACSVRELQAWVDRRVRFNPQQADAMLFPETVQLVDEASELQRKIIPITYEYLVHEDVRNAERVYSERSWKRADDQPCERSVLGVVASGPHRGEAFDVCIDKKKCLIHWKEEVKAAEKKTKAQPNSPAAKKAAEREAQARKKEQEQQEQREARRAQWKKLAPKIEAAVMAQVKVLSAASVSMLGDLLVQSMSRYGQKRKTTIPRGTTSEDLVRHLAALALVDEIAQWNASEDFPATAKALGVDLSPFVKLEAGKKGKAA